MSYSSYNGWLIIPMPSSPNFRQVQFTMSDAVGINASPFTGQQQVQAWPGGDNLGADVSLPPMKEAQARAWLAWFAALRGKANVFQLGDPTGGGRQGNPVGTPVSDGLNLAMSTTINLKGFTASAAGVYVPGDYLQIGYYLHMVAGVTTINADGAGKAVLEIWPSLRIQLADGDAITKTNCKGLFRLADNKRTWSVQETKMYGISFKVTEAR